MKNLLVTGGAGFIGSNFIKYVLAEREYNIVNLDLLTYAGNLINLKEVESHPNYRFVKGNVCDKKLVFRLFGEFSIDGVVNFAAESHVDRSILEPEAFIRTNVLGTQALLEAATWFWKTDSEDKYSREYLEGVKFLQISTDEVYGTLGAEGKFTEATPLAPNSPYSASKAAADLLVRSYAETFGLPVNITRCSNNYGPYQFPEKLIPLMIRNCKEGMPMPVYGDGRQVRDWLHVFDHCSAILAVLEKGKPGEVYNVGGSNEKANIEIVRLILNRLQKSEDLIQYVQDRPGHDRRYAIDHSKITKELGWRPVHTFEEGMEETIGWYLKNEGWLSSVTSGEYLSYYEEMYSRKVRRVNRQKQGSGSD